MFIVKKSDKKPDTIIRPATGSELKAYEKHKLITNNVTIVELSSHRDVNINKLTFKCTTTPEGSKSNLVFTKCE